MEDRNQHWKPKGHLEDKQTVGHDKRANSIKIPNTKTQKDNIRGQQNPRKDQTSQDNNKPMQIIQVNFHCKKPEIEENQVAIKRIRLPDFVDQQHSNPIEVFFSVEDPNRMIYHIAHKCNQKIVEAADRLLIVEFQKKTTSDSIREILCQGIEVNHKLFKFFGYSANQLKGRSCYLFQGKEAEIDQLIGLI